MLMFRYNPKQNMLEEIVPHNSSFAPQIVEYVKSNEALADAITRRDYFESLSEDDFIDMTQRVASLVRTGDSNQLQHYDGTTVTLMAHEVPDQREKEQLLRETWRTAQVLLHDRRLSDEDALEYAALTVAGGVLFVHPFVDGNGRTSRTLSYVIARGAESEDELRKMIEENYGGGAWHVAPNSQLALPNRRQFGGDQPECIEYEDELVGDASDPFGDVISNSVYNESILRAFIEKADTETQAIVKGCTTQDQGGRRHLDGDLLLKELATSDRATEYAQALFGSYREMRAGFVRRYLRAMVSEVPIEQRVKAPNGEREIRMTSEIRERAIGGLLLPRDQQLVEHRAYSGVYHRS
ncbi:MAG TPA: Fic family protein, partial [Candidatus Saccharimonadales bacterium]